MMLVPYRTEVSFDRFPVSNIGIIVLYPQARVSCFYYIFFFRGGAGNFRVQGFVVILLWFVFDLWGAAIGAGRTAYWCHIGGFLSGLVLTFLLVLTGVVKMTSHETSLVDVFGGPSSSRRTRVRAYR
jgi:membrane associated rhomboid family serine protease